MAKGKNGILSREEREHPGKVRYERMVEIMQKFDREKRSTRGMNDR